MLLKEIRCVCGGGYEKAVSSENGDLGTCDKGSSVGGKQCLSPGAHISAESKGSKQQP